MQSNLALASTENIWDVLRKEFALPHFENNPYVQEQIALFLHDQDFLRSTTQRAAPYLYFILQEVKRRHLPAELVLLPMIESAYNPFAYSSAGAAGMWQIMPNTASGYGIKQNWWYDGRRDVIASTKAALNHLTYLGNFFEGNWLLAIAAYDTGEGNVLSAIKRNIRAGVNTDFWSLPVHPETRAYVPRLLALAIIISHPELYAVKFNYVPNAPYFAQVDVGGQIDLNNAADLAGITLQHLKRLNPGYSRTTTDPHGPFKLILPIENVDQFTDNLARSPQYARKNSIPEIAETILAKQKTPTRTAKANNSYANTLILNQTEHYSLHSGDTLYMARYGDDLEKIAKRFHTSAKTLQVVNRLSPNKVLRTGDQIIIPTHLAQEVQKFQMSSGDTLYMVRRGETLEKIAKKFNTTPAALRVANLLNSSKVQEGDQIFVRGKIA